MDRINVSFCSRAVPLVFCVMALACDAGLPLAGHFRVDTVYDGDSFLVRDSHGAPVEIRLSGIDAPEKDQRHANKSRSALQKLIGGKTVRLVIDDEDRFGRSVARVYRESDDLYVNARMVSAGHAWVYERYNTDRSLPALQTQAKKEKRGLWQADKPVPPWRYRRKR